MRAPRGCIGGTLLGVPRPSPPTVHPGAVRRLAGQLTELGLNGVRAIGCEPHFGGDEWRIDIPRVLLDRSLPPANPVVARLVRAHADEQPPGPRQLIPEVR